MFYGMSSRDYLRRAEQCLESDDVRQLFYAAFELRCGVEERLREYLEAWDHVAKKHKQGWELTKLGAASDRAFKTDRVMRWEVRDESDREVIVVLYYTPVTKALRGNAERLGNYLHSQKVARPEGDPWWTEFKDLLLEIIGQLRVATRGTLLGPALKNGEEILMNTSLPPELDPSMMYKVGGLAHVHVGYLDEFPSELEEKAVVWKT